MKNLVKSVLVSAILFMSSALQAQKGADYIEILGVDVRDNLNSPVTTDLSIISGADTGRWTAITLKFKVDIKNPKKNTKDDGKWLDDVTLEWKGLTKPSVKWMKFAKTVKYKNLGEGTWYATVLIDPATKKRYFDDGKLFKKDFVMMATFKVGVTSQTKGRILLVKNKKARSLPSPIKVESFTKESLEEITDVLKDRTETPWSGNQMNMFPQIVKSNR
jgi:hypothetical protein